jgi:hypothetical protein
MAPGRCSTPARPGRPTPRSRPPRPPQRSYRPRRRRLGSPPHSVPAWRRSPRAPQLSRQNEDRLGGSRTAGRSQPASPAQPARSPKTSTTSRPYRRDRKTTRAPSSRLRPDRPDRSPGSRSVTTRTCSHQAESLFSSSELLGRREPLAMHNGAYLYIKPWTENARLCRIACVPEALRVRSVRETWHHKR